MLYPETLKMNKRYRNQERPMKTKDLKMGNYWIGIVRIKLLDRSEEGEALYMS